MWYIPFFLLITALLWFGDGKQELVEIVASIGCILLYGFHLLQKKSTLSWKIPPVQTILFTIFLLYTAIHISWSSDIGYSFSAFARWASAFVVFSLAASLHKTLTSSALTIGIALLTTIAVLSYGLVNMIPSLQRLLPISNLFTIPYGHAHIVDLLLLCFPLLFTTLFSHFSLVIVPCMLLGIAVAVSHARVAQLLFVFATVLIMVRKRKELIVRRYIIYGCIALACILGIRYSLARLFPSHPIVTAFTPQWYKEQNNAIARFRYWHQALLAFYESPLVGSGPGTFSLSSLKFQEFPRGWAVNAHNYPLELLSEFGILGSIGTMLPLLIFVQTKKRRPYPEWYAPVKLGSILIFFYALVDYPLNFLSVWLLWWFFLGRMSAQETTHIPKKIAALGVGMQWVSVLILSVFVIVSLIYKPMNAWSIMGSLQQEAVSKRAPDPRLIQDAVQLHKNHPHVLYQVATNTTVPMDLRMDLYRHITSIYPKNEVIQKEYMEYAYETNQRAELIHAIDQYMVTFFPNVYDHFISLSSLLSSLPIQDLIRHTRLLFHEPLGRELRGAKVLYAYGLETLAQNPQDTEVLWKLSAALAPDVSMIALERASLAHAQNNNSFAQKLLEDCMNRPKTKQHCGEYTVETLPLPGSFQNDITHFAQ